MEKPEPTATPALAANSWALLGMLSYQRELSGYDVRKWLHWGVRYYNGSPAFSQIYSDLKKLEKMGLLTSRVDSTGTRNRRLYKITQAGMDAVTRWARDTPADPPSLKHPAIMRVTLGHLSDPATLKQILQEHIAYVDEMQRDAAKGARFAAGYPSWTYARIALDWAERYYASERELTLKMIKDLDDAEDDFPKVLEGARIPWPLPDDWYEFEKGMDAESGG
ncbi:DNA-binding PadR family transcriptional regulator [Mycobacterium frederiksbergense]|uniref:DNA-binding PadR family transcriptional regulator n=1 Tax=Mycolicibacterium frederiksbergense TaxID=117567 RepID=A0ABT6L544_9MYCO|nr:PadR family transcriptional regulator [Mycolicibacterium frederiksbergense]MDH6198066.1 DNA-binding PadR family transcriptional regulator [Mycolicibacterium frederiksbergense]